MIRIFLLSLMAIFTITACKSNNVEYKYPKNRAERERERAGSIITGHDGPFEIGGDGKSKDKNQDVNVYVWRATLDVFSFMPLMSSDIKSGIIITDWYSDPGVSNERFKFNILVSSSALSATSLKVTGFMQKLDSKNQWQNSKMSRELTQDFENKILTLARKMKISNM